ncbi:MAG: sel1 repeat family protein, partial [Aliarcobacter cryaerophilus]
MFKKLIFGLCLWLFATTLSFGANLQDGYSAYEKGDYKTAFIIFEDLAKKGDAEAQGNLGAMYEYGEGVR